MKQVIAGIDWGQEDNEVVVVDHAGVPTLQQRFATNVEGVARLCTVLLSQFGEGEELCVAIEDASRPVCASLLEAGARVFVVAPKQLAAYRNLHRMADVKDDVLDAWLAADALRTHPEIFRELMPSEPSIAEIRLWSREREAVVKDRKALTEQIRELLRSYYPQVLDLPWELTDRVIVELVALETDPRRVTEARTEEIRRVLGRCRKLSAEQVVEKLSTTGRKLSDEEFAAYAQIMRHKIERLKVLRDQEKELEVRLQTCIDALAADEEVSDAEIIMSLPGCAYILTATLLAEASPELAAVNKQALRRRAIAPVTRKSGKQESEGPRRPFVRRRWEVNGRLAQCLFELGNQIKRRSPYYREMYHRMRSRGLTHGRACRGVADRVLDVLFAMLRDRTLYDPSLHGATRRAR